MNDFIGKKYFLLSKHNYLNELKKIIFFFKKKYNKLKIIYSNENDFFSYLKNIYSKEFFEIKKLFVLNFKFSKKIENLKFNTNNFFIVFNNSFKNYCKNFKNIKVFKNKKKDLLKSMFLSKKQNKDPINYYMFFFKKYIISFLLKKKNYSEILFFLDKEIYIFNREIGNKFPFNNIWDYMIEYYIKIK